MGLVHVPGRSHQRYRVGEVLGLGGGVGKQY